MQPPTVTSSSDAPDYAIPREILHGFNYVIITDCCPHTPLATCLHTIVQSHYSLHDVVSAIEHAAVFEVCVCAFHDQSMQHRPAVYCVLSTSNNAFCRRDK
jgi:hypothetical protein